MMSFLSVVVTSRYPTTNNQLTNSLNPRQQATINDGRVTLQPVQGRQISFATVPLGPTLQEQVEAILGNKGLLFVTTAKGKERMSKQCTKTKRKRDDTWFKDKCCGEPSSEQSSVVNHSETEITSDSNIIPYSQYVHETQQAAIVKNELRKLKGKELADNVVTKNTIAPEMLKIDVEPIAPRLLNNRTAHSDYLRHTQEQAAILKEVVEQEKSQNPRVKPSTSASGSQPSVNTKKDKILQTPSSTQKNKVEAYSRTVTSSLKNKNCVVEPNGTANVQHSKLNANSDLPIKPKIIKSISANNKEPSKSWGSIVSDVPSSSLDECRLSKLFSGTVKFGNDHVTKILGYGDYQIGNVTILRVYYVEGLGHNLFFVRQFYDSNLEVAFRQHTYFIHNLEVMASEHSSLEPAFHEMTPTTISSGLMPNTPPSTPYVPHSRTDWNILFQPLFDELLNPQPSVDLPAPKVIAPIAEVVALEPDASTGSPSSTTVDQDAPSPRKIINFTQTSSPSFLNNLKQKITT
ncbi:hypothetical protein Tco_0697916 [Tanacetum coccineum]